MQKAWFVISFLVSMLDLFRPSKGSRKVALVTTVIGSTALVVFGLLGHLAIGLALATVVVIAGRVCSIAQA